HHIAADHYLVKAFGVGAFLILDRYRDRLVSFMKKANRANWIEVGLVLLSVVFVSVFANGPSSLFAPLIFFFVVLGFAPQAGFISRGLMRPSWLHLGLISYSIYMMHYFVQMLFYWLQALVEHLTGWTMFSVLDDADPASNSLEGLNLWAGDFWLLISSALIIYLSNKTYNFVEKPGRDYVRNWFKRFDSKPQTKEAPVSNR
ncbi:MAG: hypothetical protein RLN72_11005, partial [Henriciella sp.]